MAGATVADAWIGSPILDAGNLPVIMHPCNPLRDLDCNGNLQGAEENRVVPREDHALDKSFGSRLNMLADV